MRQFYLNMRPTVSPTQSRSYNSFAAQQGMAKSRWRLFILQTDWLSTNPVRFSGLIWWGFCGSVSLQPTGESLITFQIHYPQRLQWYDVRGNYASGFNASRVSCIRRWIFP